MYSKEFIRTFFNYGLCCFRLSYPIKVEHICKIIMFILNIYILFDIKKFINPPNINSINLALKTFEEKFVVAEFHVLKRRHRKE